MQPIGLAHNNTKAEMQIHPMHPDGPSALTLAICSTTFTSTVIAIVVSTSTSAPRSCALPTPACCHVAAAL